MRQQLQECEKLIDNMLNATKVSLLRVKVEKTVEHKIYFKRNYDEEQKAFFHNLYYHLLCSSRGLFNCGYGDQSASYMGGISADFYCIGMGMLITVTCRETWYLSLGSLTLLILPYLYLLSRITPVTNWFVPIGLPSAITGLLAFWLLFLLFRFARINIWYKSASSFFILGVVSSTVINYFADIYLGVEPFALNRLISTFSCIIATAVIGVLGYIKSKDLAKN